MASPQNVRYHWAGSAVTEDVVGLKCGAARPTKSEPARHIRLQCISLLRRPSEQLRLSRHLKVSSMFGRQSNQNWRGDRWNGSLCGEGGHVEMVSLAHGRRLKKSRGSVIPPIGRVYIVAVSQKTNPNRRNPQCESERVHQMKPNQGQMSKASVFAAASHHHRATKTTVSSVSSGIRPPTATHAIDQGTESEQTYHSLWAKSTMT